MSKSDSASSTDKVIETIILGIRSGIFVPGQNLVEPDLSTRLGISRGTLREALKHLASAGIVTLTRYRGASISRLDRKSSMDLWQILEPLSRLAATLAAANCSAPSDKARIREAARKIGISGKAGSRAHYLEDRQNFYDTMIEIGGNHELARVMPLSRTYLVRAQVENLQTEEQRKEHVSDYAKISDAIAKRDIKGADRAMKEHFEGARTILERLPDAAFLQL